MDGIVEPPRYGTGCADRIARLISAFGNPKAPAAKLKHLGHERHPINSASFVEGSKNFLFGTNFDQVAYAEVQWPEVSIAILHYLTWSNAGAVFRQPGPVSDPSSSFVCCPFFFGSTG